MKTYDIPLSNFTKTEIAIMRKKALEGCKVNPQFISNQMVVNIMYERLHAFDRKRKLDMKEVKENLPISLTKKLIDLEEYCKISYVDEDDRTIAVRAAEYKKLDKLVDEEYAKYINTRHKGGQEYTADELNQINDFVALKELSNKEANSYDIVAMVEDYFLAHSQTPIVRLTQEVICHLGARLASKVLTEMREEGKPASQLEESINEVRSWAYSQAGLTPPRTK